MMEGKTMSYNTSHETNDTDLMWDRLIELGVSEQTLQIVTSINGYQEDTLTNILYAHTGYRAFNQFAQLEETE